MAENRDPHWKKLQQTKEHIERAESAHSKFQFQREGSRQQIQWKNKGKPFF